MGIHKEDKKVLLRSEKEAFAEKLNNPENIRNFEGEFNKELLATRLKELREFIKETKDS
ncbi:MAG: hypothetical protein KAQ87_02775 [Candidatus Pacebacteria bacterium]|nr:hypothetical protein [Candidatus Paceibacterota bacterium]